MTLGIKIGMTGEASALAGALETDTTNLAPAMDDTDGANGAEGMRRFHSPASRSPSKPKRENPFCDIPGWQAYARSERDLLNGLSDELGVDKALSVESYYKDGYAYLPAKSGGPTAMGIPFGRFLANNILRCHYLTPLQKAVFLYCYHKTRISPYELLIAARSNPRNRIWVDDVLKGIPFHVHYKKILDNPTMGPKLGNPDHLWTSVYCQLAERGLTDLLVGLNPHEPQWLRLLENMIDRQIDLYLRNSYDFNIGEGVFRLFNEYCKTQNPLKPRWEKFLNETYGKNILAGVRGKFPQSAYLKIRIELDHFIERMTATVDPTQALKGKASTYDWALIQRLAQKTGLEPVIAAVDNDPDFLPALAKSALTDHATRSLLAALYPHRKEAVTQAWFAVYGPREAMELDFNVSFIKELSWDFQEPTLGFARRHEWTHYWIEDGQEENHDILCDALDRIKKLQEKIRKMTRGFSPELEKHMTLSVVCEYLEHHGFFPRPTSGPKEYGAPLLLDRVVARHPGQSRHAILSSLFPDTTTLLYPETGEDDKLRDEGPGHSRFEFFPEPDHEPQVLQWALIYLTSAEEETLNGGRSASLDVISGSHQEPFSGDEEVPVYQVRTSAPNTPMPPMLIESLQLRIDGGSLRSDAVHQLLTPQKECKLPATLTIEKISTVANDDVTPLLRPAYGRVTSGFDDPTKITVAVPATSVTAFLPSSLSAMLLGRDQEHHYDSKVLNSWDAYSKGRDTLFDTALEIEVDREKVAALLPEEKPSSPREAINFVIRFIRENVAYDHNLDDDVTHRQFQDDYQGRGTAMPEAGAARRGQTPNELWDHLFNPIRKTKNGKVRAQCREIAFIATQLLRASGIVAIYQNGRLVKPSGRTTKRGHIHPAVLVSGNDESPRLAFFYFGASEVIGVDRLDDDDEPPAHLWPLATAMTLAGFATMGIAYKMLSQIGDHFIVPLPSSVPIALAIPALTLGLVVATKVIGAKSTNQDGQKKQNSDDPILLEESEMRIPLKIKRGTLQQVQGFIHHHPYLMDGTLHRYLVNLFDDDLPASLDRTLANVFPRRIRIPKTHQTSSLNTPEFTRRNTIKRRDKMARLLERATKPLTEEEKKEIAREISQLEYQKEKTPLISDICDKRIAILQEILRQNSLLNPEAAQIMKSLLEQDQERPEGWLPEVIVKP